MDRFPIPAERAHQPVVVVCAWCWRHKQPYGAVRPHDSGQWQTVSHAFVRAATQGALASRGLCGTCERIVSEAYGLNQPY